MVVRRDPYTLPGDSDASYVCTEPLFRSEPRNEEQELIPLSGSDLSMMHEFIRGRPSQRPVTGEIISNWPDISTVKGVYSTRAIQSHLSSTGDQATGERLGGQHFIRCSGHPKSEERLFRTERRWRRKGVKMNTERDA